MRKKNKNKTLEAKEILDRENNNELHEKVQELTAMIDEEKNLNKTNTIKDMEAKNSEQKEEIQKLEFEKNELKAKCDLEMEKNKDLEAQKNKEKENYQRFCETISGLKATYVNVTREKVQELSQAKTDKAKIEEELKQAKSDMIKK